MPLKLSRRFFLPFRILRFAHEHKSSSSVNYAKRWARESAKKKTKKKADEGAKLAEESASLVCRESFLFPPSTFREAGNEKLMSKFGIEMPFTSTEA